MKSILIIDDNASIHEDFRKILQGGSEVSELDIMRTAAFLFDEEETDGKTRRKYEVHSAMQGQDGLEMIRRAAEAGEPYLMAFVDIRMPPGWDGLETVNRIWAEFPDLSLVICTAYSDYSWDQIVGAVGESERLFVLKKPFDIVEVRQLVTAIESRNQAEEKVKAVISRLEQVNETLEQYCRAAQQADEAKNRFLANMSHELRTPLHGILSYAKFGFSGENSCEQVKEYFRRIEESGQSLLDLVNNLLDLATYETGHGSLALREVDISELMMAVLDELEMSAGEKSQTFHFDKPAGDTILIGDRTKILQAIRNVVSNAIRFSPEDSVIEVSIEADNEDEVVVRIADRGIGIPPDELGMVFDKFVQSTKTQTGAGGTGLGLAITRDIIQLHQGWIEARNREGGGSVFRFQLPRDPRKAMETEKQSSDMIDSGTNPMFC